jgi:hypothetical protein
MKYTGLATEPSVRRQPCAIRFLVLERGFGPGRDSSVRNGNRGNKNGWDPYWSVGRLVSEFVLGAHGTLVIRPAWTLQTQLKSSSNGAILLLSASITVVVF